MTDTTNKTKTIALVAGLLLLPGLLVACSSNAPTVRESASGAGQKGATIAECMRGKGYDMADPSGKSETISVPEGVDQEQWSADLTECAGAGSGAGDGVQAAKPMAGMEEQLQQAAKCIRENGFADYPDDEEGWLSYKPGDQATFDDVAKTCHEEASGPVEKVTK
ncbi:hypothetical protein AAEP80_06055 [Curtobacterium sp. L3-7]|uniref:hypothetical protein n=1 Tax=Curtobacterium sp. L3-7 TaxID=3138787 RepID=UPI003B52ABC5